jgi:hypothetical protein
MLATYPVVTLVNGSPAHQVDFSAKKGREFFFHLKMIEQAPVSVRSEPSQNINVTIRAEVIAEDGTEKGELGDFPSSAEVDYTVLRYFQAVVIESFTHD